MVKANAPPRLNVDFYLSMIISLCQEKKAKNVNAEQLLDSMENGNFAEEKKGALWIIRSPDDPISRSPDGPMTR